MIFTTTNTVEGATIQSYKGIVFGEVITGINFLKDFSAGMTNIFGGRSHTYEDELIQARTNALQEMESRAVSMGANAVVGITFDFELLGASNNMLLVTVTGTAVVIA